MDFRSRTLLALASEEGRSGLLDTGVGRSLLEAAYRFRDNPLEEVTEVRTLHVQLGLDAPVDAALGVQSAGTSSGRWDVRGTLGTPAGDAYVDAFLELRVTGEYRPVRTSVEDVTVRDLAPMAEIDRIDRRIEDDDGELPDDPAALESRRMQAIGSLLEESMAVAEDFDFDDFRQAHAIATVADFRRAASERSRMLGLELDLVVEPEETARSVDFPVSLYVLVRDDDELDVGGALEAVRRLRTSLAHRGEEGTTAVEGVEARASHPFLLIVPEAVLDDDDLPVPEETDPGAGEAALRAARLEELNSRLRTAGLAVAVGAP